MIYSYVKLAIRNLIKHKLYTSINILGLSLGLTIFILGFLLVQYEKSHDMMFTNYKQIYTVGSIFAPTSGENIHEYPNARLAYGPLIQLDVKEIETLARSIHKNHVVTVGKTHFHEGIRFVDHDFTKIFKFNYLYGSEVDLNDPTALVITKSLAKKLFGKVNVIGERISLDHTYDVYVKAVIEDVPRNSHFNSSLMPDIEMTSFISIQALVNMTDFELKGEWTSLEPDDMTYLLLPEGKTHVWLQEKIDEVFDRHTGNKEREKISGLKVRPLIEANIVVWDSLGFPILGATQLLSLLILIVACVNYTNLAIAQSFGRFKEVGLRKTFGAEKAQLYLQFFTESITLCFLAMVCAVACIELILPVYNTVTGKSVVLHYFQIIPWLIAVTLFVGVLSGIYPAFMIAKQSPIESLKNHANKGRNGSAFRSFMIGSQFAISIFILSLVFVIYFQNEKVKEISDVYQKDNTLIISGISKPSILEKKDVLSRTFSTIEGVTSVSFSSDVPYYETGGGMYTTPIQGDKTIAFKANTVAVDDHFFKTYNIELYAGRTLNKSIALDEYLETNTHTNVVINQLMAEKLGFGRDKNALGKFFYSTDLNGTSKSDMYKIVGIKEDVYFFGLHTKLKPIVFIIQPKSYLYLSIQLDKKHIETAVPKIEAVWKQVIPNYPIKYDFLDVYFNMFYRLLEGIHAVLASFAGIALSLALFGLFGLAAFMAERRTKEIGIRKVMGASVTQVVKLLVWQFSKPVLWGLILSVPFAYSASTIFLDFFPERIDFVIPVIGIASCIGLFTAWGIVAIHAIKTAIASPIYALRYE